MDFIFGYGSIINDSSRIATATSCQSPPRKSVTHVSISENSDSGGGCRDLAVAASVCSSFATRVWSFRCPTGFTALGITLKDDEYLETDKIVNSSVGSGGTGINGVLFPVSSHQDLTAFDIREVGYTRVAIPLNKLRILPQFGCSSAQIRAKTLQSRVASSGQLQSDGEGGGAPLRVWIYVPDSSHTASPSVEYPILQTYVDVCIEGCLLWGGKDFAMDFLRGTSNWSEYYLNDTPMSRRPWLHRKQYQQVDECLKDLSKLIQFSSRKHPDEFASLHLTSLKGMFGVPPRNRTFIGREDFLVAVHSKLCGEEQLASESSCLVDFSSSGEYATSSGCQEINSLKRVEIAGIGGVGKSQITIEYAHRHFSSSCYALVAWFRAESAASIATDMRKLAFDLGIIKNTGERKDRSAADEKEFPESNKGAVEVPLIKVGEADTDKDLEEYDDEYIINELMRRLGLCRFKWLFIFDNIEDPSILPAYLPRGISVGGCGHVIVTSRIQHYDWVLRGSVLTLDCFDTQDSLKYLQHTLGILHRNNSIKRNEQSESDEETLKQISLRMGNLPLALSIAVAYMVRCDVSPTDYLSHVNTTSVGDLDAISTSLNVTLRRIREESESSATVLPCLGYFAPDNISKDLVQLYLIASQRKEDSPVGPAAASGTGSAQLQPLNDKTVASFQNIEKDIAVFLDINGAAAALALISLLWTTVLFNASELSCSITSGNIEVFSSGQVFGCDIRFICGIITGCLLVLNVIVMGSWLHPRYRLCLLVNESRNISNVQEGVVIVPPSETSHIAASHEDLNHDFQYCLNLIDQRHEPCAVDHVVKGDTDKVWEIMKQFSLLSTRGEKGTGSVHRLQQAVLRASRDDTGLCGPAQHGMCLEKCIWVLSKVWKFHKADSMSWQRAGDYIEHIQVIAKHAIDMLPKNIAEGHGNSRVNESADTVSQVESGPCIREEYYLLLSVLLKEGGEYISVVLSRFDNAQLLLEWSHHIQVHLLDSLSSPSAQCSSSLPVNFKIRFVEKLNECRASTLYVRGKVFRYNGKLIESEVVLKQSLELRKRNFGAISMGFSASNNNGAIADILHELGVLYLRKKDLYTAKSFLTKSLDMKYEYESEIQETDESSTLHQLGVVATLERRYDDAESLLLQALEFQGYHHGVADCTVDMKSLPRKKSPSLLTSAAATLQQLGRVELRRGRLTQAQEFLTEALDIYKLAYGETRAASHVNVAGVRHQLGAAAMASKDYAKACEHFSIALAAREIICSQSSGGSDQVIAGLLALGQAEVERHRHSAAETLFLRAKTSIELELRCLSGSESTAEDSQSSSVDSCDAPDGRTTRSYSNLLLTKCGYSGDKRVDGSQNDFEDLESSERKRDALIKQLFFCVHLLRGVARNLNDMDAAQLYAAELKGLGKRYPSHRSSTKKHPSGPKTTTSDDSGSSSTKEGTTGPSSHLKCLTYNDRLNIFRCIDGIVDEEKVEKNCCLSAVFVAHELLTLQPDTCEFDEVKWLIAARCSIRSRCKMIQKLSNDSLSDASIHEILTTTCAALSGGTQSLSKLENDRISQTIQIFLDAVISSPRPWSKQSFLKLFYKLCDDLRNDITSYGLRVDDL